MADAQPKARVFSGIKPSGTLTLGNYLGAVSNWVAAQHERENIFCVVNQHAITVHQDPEELRKNTRHVAAVYLAAGLDPDKCIIFVQSDVREHTELAWVLNTITHYGELHRMTQFKQLLEPYEKGLDEQAKARKRDKISIGAGILNYPILMAADILLYNAQEVPVGEDQKQHVELTRDIAVRFNQLYGDTFVVPKPVIAESGARIMSLQDADKKMSKSDDDAKSYILLTDPPDVIRHKFGKAKTDSEAEVAYVENRKELKNLLTIYSVMSGETIPVLEERYAGKGYGDFKKDLGEVVVAGLAPLQERMNALLEDTTELDAILDDGAERARAIARPIMDMVNARVGLAWR